MVNNKLNLKEYVDNILEINECIEHEVSPWGEITLSIYKLDRRKVRFDDLCSVTIYNKKKKCIFYLPKKNQNADKKLFDLLKPYELTLVNHCNSCYTYNFKISMVSFLKELKTVVNGKYQKLLNEYNRM